MYGGKFLAGNLDGAFGYWQCSWNLNPEKAAVFIDSEVVVFFVKVALLKLELGTTGGFLLCKKMTKKFVDKL